MAWRVRFLRDMAHKLEELPIYEEVKKFWRAVNAILEKPRVRSDCDLHRQLSRASDSIGSNMVEGFEQGTDRAFANYLVHSKGSLAEALKWLKKAYFKKYIRQDERDTLVADGEELAKMLGGFIKYLRRCDWKDRGSHGAGDSGD